MFQFDISAIRVLELIDKRAEDLDKKRRSTYEIGYLMALKDICSDIMELRKADTEEMEVILKHLRKFSVPL